MIRKFTNSKEKIRLCFPLFWQFLFLAVTRPPRFEILCDKAALLRLLSNFCFDILLINFLNACHWKKPKRDLYWLFAQLTVTFFLLLPTIFGLYAFRYLVTENHAKPWLRLGAVWEDLNALMSDYIEPPIGVRSSLFLVSSHVFFGSSLFDNLSVWSLNLRSCLKYSARNRRGRQRHPRQVMLGSEVLQRSHGVALKDG